MVSCGLGVGEGGVRSEEQRSIRLMTRAQATNYNSTPPRARWHDIRLQNGKAREK